MYLQAISPNGIIQSTVEVLDPVWADCEEKIRAEATERGYELDILDYTPQPGSGDAPEKRCEDLASVQEWIMTLNPDED